MTSFKVSGFSKEEIAQVPSWAREHYKHKYNVAIQLLQKIIKLEANIGDLQNMALKGEYPKSIQINITVSVAQEQQHGMDAAIQQAKNQFHSTVIQALIEARKNELVQKKQEVVNCSQAIFNFLRANFQNLKANNVPVPEQEEDEVTCTVQLCVNAFKDKIEEANQLIRTRFFFQQQKEVEKQQQRAAARQEQRINQELTDPNIVHISKQIQELQSMVSKKLKTPTGSNKKPSKKPNIGHKSGGNSVKTKKNQQNSKPNAKFGNNPKVRGVQKNNRGKPLNPKNKFQKNRSVRRNQGPGNENRRR